MALVTRHALGAGGLGAALRASAGILAGLIVWGVAAAVGVAAVLATSATAFTVLKLAGAAYLVYLGARAILGGTHAAPPARGTPLKQGLLSNLLNPKIAVFYTTVIPQFVDPTDPLVMPLLLTALHLAMGVIWLPAYAWLVTRAGEYLRRPRVTRALERVTGTVLIALGLRLAFERR